MALFENRFGSKSLRALGALVVCGGLMVVGGEAIGDGHDFTLSGGAVEVSITYGTTTEATYTLGGAGAGTFDPVTLGSITSGFTSNIFTLVADLTVANPALTLSGAFINTGDSGEFRIEAGGVAGRIDFTDTPAARRIGLQNIDTITIDGGTSDIIRASGAEKGVTFNLLSGAITSVIGSGEDDTFIIGPGITVSGTINGRDGRDTLRFADGFDPDTIDITGDIGAMTLTYTFNGNTIELTLANIDNVARFRAIMETFATGTPDTSLRTGGMGNDIFMITGDTTDGTLMLGVINGLEGDDELQLNDGAVVASVSFNNIVPMGGEVYLENFEIITLNGGTVNGAINVSAANAGVTFNLVSGVAGDTDITGSDQDDLFIISGDITGAAPLDINGLIQGARGEDEVRLIDGAVVENLNFGTFTDGDLSVRDVETITIDGGTINNTITGPATATTFNLLSGMIGSDVVGGDIVGGAGDDTFIIGSGITISGMIDGGGDGGDMDTLSLASGFNVDSANFFETTLTLTFGGSTLEFTLIDIENVVITGLTTAAAATLRAFGTGTLSTGPRTGGAGNDVFMITGDATDSTITIDSVIDGAGGDDEFQLSPGGVVASVAFSDTTPMGGAVHLENIETITLNGGTINGALDASAATTSITINLISGTVDGNISGSEQNDIFTIAGDITGDTPALDINGVIDGRDAIGGEAGRVRNVLILNTGAVVGGIVFSDQVPSGGALHLQNIETINFEGGTVDGDFDISAAATRTRINMTSGEVTGDVIGSDHGDTFVLNKGLTLGGSIDGGGSGSDAFGLGAGLSVTSLTITGSSPFTFAGGDADDLPTLISIERFLLAGGTITDDIDVSGSSSGVTFILTAGTIGRNILGSNQGERFFLLGDTDGANPQLAINGVIDGGGGRDTLDIRNNGNDGAVVTSIVWSDRTPTSGTLHLRSIESILILDGTTIIGDIDASAATAGVSFELRSSTIGGDIIGSDFSDTFRLIGDQTFSTVLTRTPAFNGVIDGGEGVDSINIITDVTSIVFSDRTPVGVALHLQNFEFITLDGSTVNGNIDTRTATAGVTLSLNSGSIGGNVIGSNFNDVINFRSDLTGANSDRALAFDGVVDGGGGTNTIDLGGNGVATGIIFSNQAPTASGALHLQNIRTIGINTGMLNGNLDASAARARVGVNLVAGTITGNVIGSNHDDSFSLYSTINIGGYLDGGGGTDTLFYNGASGTDIPARGGLDPDTDITDNLGSVRNIESQQSVGFITSLGVGGGLGGLGVRGIEVLSLSPALNLYGALSDALMQFGAQTAQGFGLADLNLASGRATQLMSKDSSLSKGRIWAHKVTHAGNGKGSIGLGLSGLTARADSDYNYEMSLTQHGFDAPVAATRLGAFNLRAVSHTMTGTIETNVAEAKVSGYGAGVALLWQKHNFSAHLTSLASAYEVEATTSSLNPQAVVNEVSEGSFSAINAVVSAGLADKRELAYGLSLRTTADVSWQTLSLDDFTETGAGGIAINFDKATRFTARVGAGLESEHWFSDVAFVHETSSGGTLSSGLSQDYRQDDGTAIEMKLGGKVADLATGLTLKAYAGLRASLDRSDAIEPSGHLALNWRF